MNKIRINELARELEVKAHEILDRLPELGVTEKKTHSSSIDEDVAIKLRRLLGGLVPAEYAEPEARAATPPEHPVAAVETSPAPEVVPGGPLGQPPAPAARGGKRGLRTRPPRNPRRIVRQAAHRYPFVRHWRAVRRRARSLLQLSPRVWRPRPLPRPLRLRPPVQCRPWPDRFRRRGPVRCCPDRANRCRQASTNPSLRRRRFSPDPVWLRALQSRPHRREALPDPRRPALRFTPRPDRLRDRLPDSLPRVPWCRRVRTWQPDWASPAPLRPACPRL